MKPVPMYESEERNAANFLQLSLRFAREYFEELCKLRNRHTEAQIQQSKELTIMHRSLWTSLVIEVRKLFGASFGAYDNHSLREIDFLKQDPHKKTIDQIYGNRTIQSILTTSNTFTVHLAKKNMKIMAVDEICKSDLGKLLERLEQPVNAFAEHARKEHPPVPENADTHG